MYGQWRALGAAIRAIHGVVLPPAIGEYVRVETYSDVSRRKVRQYLTQLPVAGDAVALDLAALLSNTHREIIGLGEHAERLAATVQRKHLPLVPCHGDLHAGNVLVGTATSIAIVDWDDPVLAPKERDLMFVGAGIGGVWNRPEEAVAFYDGYGRTSVDAEALAYYRCERIVEDIAVFCDQLLAPEADDGLRRRILLQKLAAAFEPNDVVEIAERTVAAL
jgi:spectinomycin phosphotransferase